MPPRPKLPDESSLLPTEQPPEDAVLATAACTQFLEFVSQL